VFPNPQKNFAVAHFLKPLLRLLSASPLKENYNSLFIPIHKKLLVEKKIKSTFFPYRRSRSRLRSGLNIQPNFGLSDGAWGNPNKRQKREVALHFPCLPERFRRAGTIACQIGKPPAGSQRKRVIFLLAHLWPLYIPAPVRLWKRLSIPP
jgi:hypothetical protein